jgi:hypothetical protein
MYIRMEASANAAGSYPLAPSDGNSGSAVLQEIMG